MAAAAPGDLDPSFDGDGRVTTDFGSNDLGNGVAIQADGKIVVAGGSGATNARDFALARYNPDGSLDSSFSGDGLVTTDFGIDDSASAVAVQGDGKIVVAGVSNSAGSVDFALARYNPDGSLDSSFSGDGRLTTDLGSNDEAFDIAIQTDGKIIAAGDALTGATYDFALARYNPDGSLDSSFDSDGRVTTDFGSDDFAHGVAIQADGKIVAAGTTFLGNHDFALARYNTNGSLDTSFDGDGRLTTDFGSSDEGRDVSIQSDGKIVAAGSAISATSQDFALARYNTNGSLDSSFDGDGRVTTDFSVFAPSDQAFAVAIQADGKILAAGTSCCLSGSADFALARHNPDGSLDSSFSGDGLVTTDFGAAELANGVALQADGKIVLAGSSLSGASFQGDFAVARYLTAAPVTHTLTVTKGGTGSGTVTSSPAGIDCGPTCAASFAHGTAVTLTASAASGSVFAGWSGGGCSGTDPCTLTLNADTTVTATFNTAAEDVTPPTVTCSASPATLWPPNHKLVTVTASVSVTDAGSGPDGFDLVSVTSSQADSGLDADDVPNDIQGWTTGTADTSGQLRAERFRSTRTYTLTYRGYDMAGNSALCSTTVIVPKSQGMG